MKSSEELDKISPAIVAFQQGMPQVKKENTAEVVSKRTGGKYSYKYADLADVFTAALPVATHNGLSVLQGFNSGNVQTRLLHESGQWIEDDGVELPKNLSPQDLGGAITYFRRYGALAILGIAPEEDDDAAAAQKAHASAQRPEVKRFQDQAKASLRPGVDFDPQEFDDEPPVEAYEDAKPLHSTEAYKKTYQATQKAPVSKPADGNISAGQVKRLWAIARQADKSKDAVMEIVGSKGFDTVESVHWKKYNEIIEEIQA